MIPPASSAVAGPDHRKLVGLITVPLAIAVGLAAAAGPTGVAAVALLLAGAGLVLVGPRVPVLFQVVLAGLLIGYMFLGRGFAYIGTGTAYVGEAGLLLAVAVVVVSLGRWRISVVEGLLLAFMAWGAARTIPYLGQYGALALRDAVNWVYALVAIGVAITLTPTAMERAVGLYRRLAPVLVFWFPVAAVLTIVLGDRIPAVPGSSVPVVYFKAGDAGVHLAGIAAFVLAGLYRGGALREALVWVGWATSGALVAALNRGGMVAAVASVFALLFVRRLSHWLVLAAVAAVLVIGAWVADPRVDLGEATRDVSFQQLVENVTSIFVDRPDTSTQATKEWRLEWWTKITDYTINGPFFWTGKGYGINLANDDGFQVNADESLRAPHSAHFEILARSGLPGLVLWVVLQVSWCWTMLRAGVRARRSGRTWWLAVIAWLFAYWLAAIVNMSVDVYLGGPQGGIWFWAVFGAGLAVTRMVGAREPDPDEEPSVAGRWSRAEARETVG